MSFVQGFLLGMTLQLSIGPVCTAVLYKSIARGFREAFKMVCAVTIVDALYIAASFLGIANLLRVDFLKKAVLISGACALLYFGLQHVIRFLKGNQYAGGNGYEGDKGKSSFIYGVKLTIINPLTIVFWSGIFGSLIASGTLSGINQLFTYSLGCISATMVFLSCISIFGDQLSKYLSVKLIRGLDLAVGLFLLVFAVKMIL